MKRAPCHATTIKFHKIWAHICQYLYEISKSGQVGYRILKLHAMRCDAQSTVNILFSGVSSREASLNSEAFRKLKAGNIHNSKCEIHFHLVDSH